MQRVVHQARGHHQVEQELVLALPDVAKLGVVVVDLVDQVGALQQLHPDLPLMVGQRAVLLDHVDDLGQVALDLRSVAQAEAVHQLIGEVLSVAVAVQVDGIHECALVELGLDVGLHAHREMSTRRCHMVEAGAGRVAAVGQDMVAFPDRELRERLARACPLRLRHLEEITRQRRQAYAVMDAPQGARLARFLDRCRVEGPDLEVAIDRQRHPLFLEQGHAQRTQPIRRLLQPLEQRHARKVRQTSLSRSYDGLSQRMATAKMKQQNTQQGLRRLVLAQSFQGPALLCQLLPVGR